ncbi:hypothetical protein WA026_012875 [Henosepilachna vigintioctopunctata]|uniref:PHD-type domain-containing protein n=1 Tax=Henosepilachna vigintioctopunctata TaxID=420089 RepID=A0AAW1TLE2_9CUCU
MAAETSEIEKCSKCLIEFNGDKAIGCEGKCKRWFHLKCCELNNKDFNFIKNCKGVKWFCQICYGESEVMGNILKALELLNQKVNTLECNQEKILQEKYRVESSAPKNEEKSKGSKCALIVEAKSTEINKSSDDIKRAIKDAIKPEDLKIGVKNMKKSAMIEWQ